jgi:hypothetical protein
MARDATFKKSAFNGKFHDPNNWEEGYVPDGVATIPGGLFLPGITFGQPLTKFGAFRTLGQTGFIIAEHETVKLEGGVTMPIGVYNPQFAVFGTLEGHVIIEGLAYTHGTLYGTGTIIGDVENHGGQLSPGNSPDGGTGTLTIDGNYLQKPGSDRKLTDFRIGALPGQPPARLAVTGRVTLVQDYATRLYIVMDRQAQAAANTTLTALTATGGVSGIFGVVEASRPGVFPHPKYETNSVLVSF